MALGGGALGKGGRRGIVGALRAEVVGKARLAVLVHHEEEVDHPCGRCPRERSELCLLRTERAPKREGVPSARDRAREQGSEARRL